MTIITLLEKLDKKTSDIDEIILCDIHDGIEYSYTLKDLDTSLLLLTFGKAKVESFHIWKDEDKIILSISFYG